MLYGLYLSSQGAEAQSARMDVIANNLANASTNGFKKDFAVFQHHRPFDTVNGTGSDVPEDQLNHTGGLSLGGVVTDHSDGPLQKTGGQFDVALQGPGFFRVLVDRQQYLTRDGQFSLNEQGELVTSDRAAPVLAQGGQRIVVPPETKRVEFTADGSVFAIDPSDQRVALGRLDLVRAKSPDQMEKVGKNLFTDGGQTLAAGPELQVKQGFLEGSSTNPVSEMMDLIQASRQFETNINMLRMQDDSMSRLLQAVPLRA